MKAKLFGSMREGKFSGRKSIEGGHCIGTILKNDGDKYFTTLNNLEGEGIGKCYPLVLIIYV